MANIHGFNDLNGRPNNNNNANGLRQPMMGGMGMGMGGGAGMDSSSAMAEHIRENKVPFMNTLASDRPPLQ